MRQESHFWRKCPDLKPKAYRMQPTRRDTRKPKPRKILLHKTAPAKEAGSDEDGDEDDATDAEDPEEDPSSPNEEPDSLEGEE